MNLADVGWLAPVVLAMVEAGLVLGLAATACRFLSAAGSRRAAWHAAFVGIALVLLVEGLGWRRAAPATSVPGMRGLRVTLDPGPGSSGVETALGGAGRAAGMGGPPRGLRSTVRWDRWLAGTWAVGAAGLLAWLGIGRMRLWRLARRLPDLSGGRPEEIAGLVVDGEPRDVRWVSWRGLSGPVAFGLWRPTVAVPLDFAERFGPDQRRCVLVHELGHLAGRDPWWFLLADVVCAVGWMHPGLWWARRRLREESEWVADEAVAGIPGGRLVLAETLAVLGRELVVSGGLGVGGDGMKSGLALRVQRLLATEGPVRSPRRGWVPMLGALTVLGLAALPLGISRGQAGVSPLVMTPARAPVAEATAEARGTDGASVTPHDSGTNTTGRAEVPTGGVVGTNSGPPSLFPGDQPTVGYRLPRLGVAIANYAYLPVPVPAGEGKERAPGPGTAAAPVAPAPVSPAASREPVVELEVKWVEHVDEGGGAGWLDWIFGESTEAPEEVVRVEEDGIRMDRIQTTNQWRALDEGQYRALLARLETLPRVDVLTPPRITTRAGRQAQVAATEERQVAVGPVDVPGTNGGPASVVYGTKAVAVGTQVDLMPRMEAGRHRVQVVGQYTEFVGYEAAPAKGVGKGANGMKAVPALPLFQVRRTVGDAECGPGETLVLRGPVGTRVVRWKDRVPVLGSIPLAGRLFRKEGVQTNRTRVYLFITPREVDGP